MPSFGKNVWLVENGKKSIQLLDELENFERLGFDKSKFYFVKNATTIHEDLPKDFDAYSNPNGIEGINYIDPNDEIVLDFNTKKYLPKGFDAYKRG